MRVAAVIVTFNGKKWYDRCITSLQKSSIPVQIIVIDNASSDDTIDYISMNYPDVHIISNEKNYGFAKANNLGVRYALSQNVDFVFLLNQDAWVEEDTLEILLHTFVDNENVAIASPIHMNGNKTGLDKGFCNYVGPYYMSDAYMKNVKPYYEVPFVNAAAWLISVDCINKVGGFDTCLFKHYGEDDNYAQRVYYHGLKIIINTQCTICHDREQRKVSPATSSFNLDDPFFYDRYQKGNVLLKYDSNKQLHKLEIELLKAYIGFHPKRVRRLRNAIDFEKQVAYSRKVNIEGGRAWLFR